MCDLLEFCHIFSTTFTPSPTSAAFNEGQRNVGLRLLNDIMSACPDHYVLMMRERNERDAARDTRSDARDADSIDDTGELPGSPDTGGGTEGRAEPGEGGAGDGADEGWRDEVYADFERRQKPA
jgi:hypothetical protein